MKVTARQLEILISFLEQHRDLARGKFRGKEGSQLSARLWESCAEMLNSEFPGANKSGNDWKKYYNVYKCRTIAKNVQLRKECSGTDGGEPEPGHLTPLQERLCALLLAPPGGKLLLCKQNPLEPPKASVKREDASAMCTEVASEEEYSEGEDLAEVKEVQEEDNEHRDSSSSSDPLQEATGSNKSAFSLAIKSLEAMEQQRIAADRRLAEVVSVHAAAMAKHAEAMQDIACQFRRFVDIYAAKAGAVSKRKES